MSSIFITISLECGDGGYQNIVRGRVRNNSKEDSSGFATFGLSSKEIPEHNQNLNQTPGVAKCDLRID